MVIILYMVFENILDVNDVDYIKYITLSEGMIDGRTTSVVSGKNNRQLPLESTAAIEAGEYLVKRLSANADFMLATQPMAFHAPLFSLYEQGMRYPDHIDVGVMGDLRTDIAITVFLADPETYDGGELMIDTGLGWCAFKLTMGSAVAYPATTIHQVAEVTRGRRLVAALWVQSRVRAAEERALLAELGGLATRLQETCCGPRLRRAYRNLTRMWSDAAPAIDRA
jgi:PKHD-type hydroxylase